MVTIILILHTLLVQYEKKVGKKHHPQKEHFKYCSGVVPKTTTKPSEQFSSDVMKQKLGNYLETISQEKESTPEMEGIQDKPLHSTKIQKDSVDHIQTHFSKQLDEYFKHTDLQREFQKNDFTNVKQSWEKESSIHESGEKGDNKIKEIQGFDDFDAGYHGPL